jgi:activator of HSP90 ATPase
MKHTLIGTAIFTVAAAMATSFGCTGAKAEQQDSSRNAPPQSITIHQEVDFAAPPQRLYEALLDSKQFAALSGAPAEISREVGGAFSAFGGHIVGRNVELVPNKRIVQAWRPVTWPEGVYSIVRFEFKPQGSGTRLVFDHVGFPEGNHDSLAKGWEHHYWTLLRKCAR